MEENRAIEVLIDVANLAQTRGVLSLQDAVLVYQAVKLMQNKIQENENSEITEKK